MNVKEFFLNTARGAAIGVSMIIPGVSGGTMAVLLNVYEKIIDAISNLRRDFKNSFLFLLPIMLGAIAAVAVMALPLQYLFDKAPFPTVALFAGLMLGSMPKIFKDALVGGFKVKVDIAAAILPLALVIGICFIPGLNDVNLSSSMPIYGYFLLILIGAVASCALVVPGISGSMLLLILGYYNSILNTVSALKTAFGHSLLVLAIFAIGLIIGFFSIAKLMKFLLNKFPRATRWAIIGFVIGSLPAIFITYDNNFPEHIYSSLSTVQIVIGVILLAIGAVGTFALTAYVDAKEKKAAAAKLQESEQAESSDGKKSADTENSEE